MKYHFKTKLLPSTGQQLQDFLSCFCPLARSSKMSQSITIFLSLFLTPRLLELYGEGHKRDREQEGTLNTHKDGNKIFLL